MSYNGSSACRSVAKLKTEANKYKGSLGISELKLNKPKPATDGKHLLTAVYFGIIVFCNTIKINNNLIFS